MRSTLILGAGYVGEALADFLQAAGERVVACTASPASAAKLGAGKSYPVRACDVSDPAAVQTLREAEGALDHVVLCASSGRGGAERYRAVYLEGARNLVAGFAGAQLTFTSSTSVYAQVDGGWVEEISPAEPSRETGRILREAEEVVLAAGGIVARVAGIYGPERSVLLRRFLAGQAVIEGDGTRWINQAHRDDIVAALAVLRRCSRAPGVYNVCDDRPLTQIECYAWLARHFGRELPPVAAPDFERKRGWTSKRVSNAKLRGLGWSPHFPSFLDAVAAGLEPGASTDSA